MSYKILKMLVVASAALASTSVVNAHTIKNNVAPFNYNNGAPTDINMGVERDVHGAPHGSMSNPSPHGYTSRGNGGSSAFAMERESRPGSWQSYTGGGSEGHEQLLKTY